MKKALRNALSALKIALVVFSVLVLFFTLLSSFGINRENGIFGIKMYIVLSDSMKGTFNIGDIAVSKEVKDTGELKEGDIITFRSINPANYGEIVTHKIRSLTQFEGEPAFVTYGTATGTDDEFPASADSVIGKYLFAVPKIGHVFGNLKTPLGYTFLVLLPFGLLIGFEGFHFFKLFKKYKRELEAESEKKLSDLLEENKKLREAVENMNAAGENQNSDKSEPQ